MSLSGKKTFFCSQQYWNVLNCTELFCLANLAEDFASLFDTAERLYAALLHPANTADYLSSWALVCFFFQKNLEILSSFLSILCLFPTQTERFRWLIFDKKDQILLMPYIRSARKSAECQLLKRSGLELTCTLSQDCTHKLLEAIKPNCGPHNQLSDFVTTLWCKVHFCVFYVL